MNGTFQLQMHVIDSIYEWFSSHFLECEYRSSIASIRLVYEVATSHRANQYWSMLAQYLVLVRSTRARCPTEAQKYGDSMTTWGGRVRSMM